ncbi:MAG: hypothetical protein RH949_01000 [Coleofasciculus sp. A1-SPW-01]|uniref:hypothetical protein n=1 Tax=Coleofasciculus sp. A1-SPW-01 TaxID=3070819 RepID=UPI0033054E67
MEAQGAVFCYDRNPSLVWLGLSLNLCKSLQSNNPTAIILSIAILLWVLRPVMLRQQSNPGETLGSTQGKLTPWGRDAIAAFVRAFNSNN